MKGWKKIFHANGDQKKAGVAILIPDKIDFKTKAVERDKEGHYIMIKGSIQEDITIINIYAPNIGAPQYVRQMLTSMKGEINNNTIIVGDFNNPLTPMDRSTKQKINKETQTLNDTIDQLDLIDIYRTFHPQTMNFTFFSSTHGNFSRRDHILGHKSNLDKFKKIEIFPGIFSDHNALRLDLNYGSEVKTSACNVGDLGSIPGSGRSPGEGNGNPLQYSCLENPMDGRAWWATIHGVAKSWT